uniref:EEF1A lysine methyltransferase 2 n=1 Tax=Anas zonorhyncha TaxID=75864 RepID=A0A8B9UAD7_9AVES
ARLLVLRSARAAAAAARPEGGMAGVGGAAFGPSALGTKPHWDAAYERELRFFQDTGDAGEIWFGEESMVRVIRWLEKQKVSHDSPVLDIGTGNGVLLVELVGILQSLCSSSSVRCGCF